MHLSTHTWMRPEPLERSISRASSLGYTSLELAGEPDKLPPVSTIQSLLSSNNMTVWAAVTLMTGDRDLTSTDPSRHASSVAYVKSVVQLASDLGAGVVTIVPGTVGKLAPTGSAEDEWAVAVAGLREINAFALTKGVRLAIEPLNRFETYFINRVDQALALADAVDGPTGNVGLAFDPFHAAIEEKDMYETLAAAGARVFDVHLGDNNRLAPGDGHFDWRRMVTILKQIGYDGGLAFEAMPPIDRTPASPYKAAGGQLEDGWEHMDIDPDLLQFLKDHASGVLADDYFTSLLRKGAETMLPLLNGSG